jgi:hypothetical protein
VSQQELVLCPTELLCSRGNSNNSNNGQQQPQSTVRVNNNNNNNNQQSAITGQQPTAIKATAIKQLLALRTSQFRSIQYGNKAICLGYTANTFAVVTLTKD